MIAVSLLILALIVCFVGVGDTWKAVSQAGVGAFAAVGAVMLASIVLRAAALEALCRPIGHAVPFRTLLAAEVVGTAGNLMTPSTYLGGEPLKVVYIANATGHRYHEVAGTVLLSKYMEVSSFVFLFSISTGVAAVYYRDLLFAPPYLVAGVSLLVVAAALLLFSAVLW
ncbi:MAG: flippase-like domain-containing protein, partial [Planctomycetota bacterium]